MFADNTISLLSSKKHMKLFMFAGLGDWNDMWAPCIHCITCLNFVVDWPNRFKVPFAIPMVQRALFHPSFLSTEPHLLYQAEKTYLFCDLKSSRHKSELLSSRLKGLNLLENPLARINPERVKDTFCHFLSQKGNLVYSYKWELSHGDLWPTMCSKWIAPFYRLLEAEYENCGNIHTSVPVAYGLHIKDSYGNMHPLVERVQYSKYPHMCGAWK
jgi:hypothetical protein